jgi:hypothetical protein
MASRVTRLHLRAPVCLLRWHLTLPYPLPCGVNLEVLFAIARGRMLSLFSLHLSALFRFMASYRRSPAAADN